jgi:predicted alpha/beta-hydrolase family hydrolase
LIHTPISELGTPFLIIQGRNDVYGGGEILRKYTFNSNTSIFLMDTDHGFNMEKQQWQILFNKMEEVLQKIRSKPRLVLT